MELLRERDRAAPPADTLYARLSYRRHKLRAVDGDPQHWLLREFRWLYRCLDRKLMAQLRPLFEASALRSLILYLRQLESDARSAPRPPLQTSLLSPAIQREFAKGPRTRTLVSRLERRLAETQPYFRGLEEAFLRHGPGGVEQALVGGHLQHALAQANSPALREHLGEMLDIRNLTALYKHLHWQVKAEPPLLDGGRISRARCLRLWRERDLEGLKGLVRTTFHVSGSASQRGLEDVLLDGVSARLQRAGRLPLHPVRVIDYLWRCRMTARSGGLALEQSGEDQVS
jgi:hypothetical protein